MALTLTVTDEQLQETFQKSLDKLLEPGNYDNPVKRTLDSILGYSGSMKGEMSEQITKFLSTSMQSPEFQAILGQAMATEMAKRAVDALEKKK